MSTKGSESGTTLTSPSQQQRDQEMAGIRQRLFTPNTQSQSQTQSQLTPTALVDPSQPQFQSQFQSQTQSQLTPTQRVTRTDTQDSMMGQMGTQQTLSTAMTQFNTNTSVSPGPQNSSMDFGMLNRYAPELEMERMRTLGITGIGPSQSYSMRPRTYGTQQRHTGAVQGYEVC